MRRRRSAGDDMNGRGRSSRWLWLHVAPALCSVVGLVACGTMPTDPLNAEGAGGAGASGGQGGGDSGSGGSATGGASGSDVPLGACRGQGDCPLPMVAGGAMATTRCASPFTPNQDMTIGGVYVPPLWCGSQDCPTLAPAPAGSGDVCETDEECTATGSGALASHCSAGACAGCETDDDCTQETPFCTLAATAPTASWACVGCLSDDDCGGDTPACVYLPGIGPRCAECSTTEHCAVGVCSDSACVPACESDADCPDPATACTNARCEARACAQDGSCPDNMACTDGTCRRRACWSDAECEGTCVNGSCFEAFGDCVQTIGYP
jgi:hypothetical protein